MSVETLSRLQEGVPGVSAMSEELLACVTSVFVYSVGERLLSVLMVLKQTTENTAGIYD